MIPKYLLNSVLASLLVVASCGVLATNAEVAEREAEEALSKTPDLENGRKVFMICAVCHTPEGWGGNGGMYPQIAGQLQSVIIKQLADIRARNRDNPMMRPFTSPRVLGGTQQIADVAAYIAQLPMNPQNEVGPGYDLAHGEQIYKEHCVDCHGDQGQGDAQEHVPMIRGQHYHYLLRQFERIRLGKRRNADPKMVSQIRRFTPRDVAAVMDYVSRLKAPAEKLAEPGWRNPDFPNYHRQPVPPQRPWPMPR